jgi:hypothetical protein
MNVRLKDSKDELRNIVNTEDVGSKERETDDSKNDTRTREDKNEIQSSPQIEPINHQTHTRYQSDDFRNSHPENEVQSEQDRRYNSNIQYPIQWSKRSNGNGYNSYGGDRHKKRRTNTST